MGWFRRKEDVFAPQPRWAGGALIGHLDPDGSPMVPAIGWPAIDRRRLDGEVIDKAWLKAKGKIAFGHYTFDNCTFVLCTVRDIEGASVRFNNCRFIDCDFSGHPDGTMATTSMVFDRCALHGQCDVPGTLVHRNRGNFMRLRLVDSRFVGCMLHRVDFSHLVEFENVRMTEVQGLPTCIGLDRVQVAERGRDLLNADLAAAPVGWLDRFASWERLRTFGRLPLFGASLSVLVAIPVLFFGLAVFNDQLDRVQDLALRDDVNRRLAEMILAIRPLAVPALSFWLLVSTVMLGIGSLLFALACPPRVREFSLERWTDELRQSALRYLPLSWGGRWARAIAAPCYVIGGGGTLLILLVKLWNAGAFIWANSTFPW